MDSLHLPCMSRRTLLQAAAYGAASAGVGLSPIASAVAGAVDDMEVMTYTACLNNCGSRCVLRAFTKKGKVIRIETDSNTPDSDNMPNATSQIRACLRGRSTRQRLYSKERLRYPMKRVGPRGSGKFERISWDEALDTIYTKLKGTIEKYGNEAVYLQYGSGSYQMVSVRGTVMRLLNMLGGSLGSYGTYSSAQINRAMPFTFGIGANGSHMTEIQNASLVVAFGNNPSVTRGSGGGIGWEYECGRNKGLKPRIVLIDPIYTDSALGKEDEWVPIRIGTDAALCEALAYVMITENRVNQEFLDKYCVGYDEKTLPASAPKHSDYKSHILGLGPDKTPKTPEWAARITGVPVDTIVRLAREMSTAEPVFFTQGYGSQRQINGEETVRAIAMLPILTGNIGLPGTNHGGREGDAKIGEVGIPQGKNPVKTKISFFTWFEAIDHGEQMTALADGVQGKDKLDVGIKFMWNTHSNVLMNQHSDHNYTQKVLADESKCEFILVSDNQMTATCKWADILLPDLMPQELNDLAADGYASGTNNFMVAIQKAVEPQWEQRSTYWVCTQIAKRFGIEEKFTEGRTQEQWVEWCYEQTRKKNPNALPDFATFWKKGLVKFPKSVVAGKTVVLEAFRRDPEKNKLKTPSGKIEIYSERLAKIARTWKLRPGEVISPIPVYWSGAEMAGDKLQKKYPLQCYGYHGQGHTHSTYYNVPWLREVMPDELLINPVDAAPRGISNGDRVLVFNDRGRCEMPAKVTPRIMPGVVSFPQGAWYTPRPDGTDVGPSINTLTSSMRSPLAKANPQHTNLVQVKKI